MCPKALRTHPFLSHTLQTAAALTVRLAPLLSTPHRPVEASAKDSTVHAQRTAHTELLSMDDDTASNQVQACKESFVQGYMFQG